MDGVVYPETNREGNWREEVEEMKMKRNGCWDIEDREERERRCSKRGRKVGDRGMRKREEKEMKQRWRRVA